VGTRLREERERLGLSQPAFADLGGAKKHSQIHYESDRRAPDSDYLSALAAHGVDVLYVVTGQRMSVTARDVFALRRKYRDVLELAEIGESIERLEAVEAAAGTAKERNDPELLTAAIAAVKEGLAGRSIDPMKRTGLVLAAYDLLEEDTTSSTDRIVRLVRASSG
jgi:transcriptional regulator with XRE-family HTH domain